MSSSVYRGNVFVHESAVLPKTFDGRSVDWDLVQIGENTRIWQFAVISAGVEIGSECNICSHVFIEHGVKIGNRVTVKCGVYLWEGVTIEDDVFIGPNVTFTNDLWPRSRKHKKPVSTTIRAGASIGAGAVILPVTIGAKAMIGAGAVVLSDVPKGGIVLSPRGELIEHRVRD